MVQIETASPNSERMVYAVARQEEMLLIIFQVESGTVLSEN